MIPATLTILAFAVLITGASAGGGNGMQQPDDLETEFMETEQ